MIPMNKPSGETMVDHTMDEQDLAESTDTDAPMEHLDAFVESLTPEECKYVEKLIESKHKEASAASLGRVTAADFDAAKKGDTNPDAY